MIRKISVTKTKKATKCGFRNICQCRSLVIFDILNFQTNILREFFQFLYLLPGAGTGGFVPLVIELDKLYFQFFHQFIQFFNSTHIKSTLSGLINLSGRYWQARLGDTGLLPERIALDTLYFCRLQ